MKAQSNLPSPYKDAKDPGFHQGLFSFRFIASNRVLAGLNRNPVLCVDIGFLT